MTHPRISSCLPAMLAVASLLGAYSCGGRTTEGDLQGADRTSGTDRAAVRVTVSESRDYNPTLFATGTLVADRRAELRALVAGDLERLPVDIGDHVREGDLLFQIRLVDYRLALQRAEAALTEAEAAVEDTERESRRLENLLADGAATEQMRDKAITANRLAKAAVERIRAARDTAAQQLEDATVNAPYSGVITSRFAEPGEFSKKGERVVEITDLAKLNAELDIPERFVGAISKEMPATLEFEAGVADAVGVVVAINPKVDRSSRTFRVKVEVENASRALSAGMFCTVRLGLPQEDALPAVLEAAVIRDEGRSTVWIVEDGVAFQRLIEEVGSAEGFVLTRSGLKVGERVVIEGFGGLVDGTGVVVEDE